MKNTFVINGIELESSTEVSNKITIKSHPYDYDVVFERFINKFSDNEVVLVDAKVAKLYDINHKKLVSIDATEENKTMDTVLFVCDKLLEYGFDKGNTLIVIGGGIIQDIGAYVGKTFKRGIKWVYVPTTLLSQCDSCIGGKTALNFRKYKNQLALFSAPSKVIIDTSFLKTLPKTEITSGYGEIVKLFLTGGDYYINNLNNFDLDSAIFHSLSIKKAVIEYDEFENCERKSLNYGHSFGHAIESLTNYEITHGESVILGIEIINKLFTKSEEITSLTSKYISLDRIKHINVNKLIYALKTDKKVKDGIISFVVVDEPGNTLFLETKIDDKLEDDVRALFIN